jgi:hypothetical protein
VLTTHGRLRFFFQIGFVHSHFMVLLRGNATASRIETPLSIL